jgi:hypothetical protein
MISKLEERVETLESTISIKVDIPNMVSKIQVLDFKDDHKENNKDDLKEMESQDDLKQMTRKDYLNDMKGDLIKDL